MDRALLITGRTEPTEALRMVEICRSFSYKLNMDAILGTKSYESRDFFASQKATCTVEQAAQISEDLQEFCYAEVMKSVRDYVKEVKAAMSRRAS